MHVVGAPTVKSTAPPIAAVVSITAALMLGAATAHADEPVPPGCQADRVGVFGTQFRTICDAPKAPDGSWQRTTKIFSPGQRAFAITNIYTVTDDTIPPGEPGHLS